MSEREVFLAALAQNEDDTAARLVFADWLEEQGEHEEADRHRKWPAAKQWLVEFARENNLSPKDAEEYGIVVIAYDKLLELGRQAMESLDGLEARDEDATESRISCEHNLTMCYALEDHRNEFWSNWSIVTGIPSPQDSIEKIRFVCCV